MNDPIDLNSLERDTFRSTWNDGLLDLLAGLGLLGIGLLWLTDHAAFGGLVPALLIPVWLAARRSLIEPRAGYFRPNAERRGRIRFGLWGVLLAGVVMLGAGLLVYFVRDGAVPAQMVRGLPAMLLALLAGLCWVLFGLPRMPAYAALLVVSGCVCVWQQFHPGWSMAAPGLLILLTGVLLLVRFVRRHPLPRSAA